MKRGISLIAVLMFMLAATTASVVVFRMIGSENFSSGARLKATEAYQASESGVDALRAWMSSRALDASALVTQYEEQPKPIKVDLGDFVWGERKQDFNIYLMGIDSKTKKTLKLKFLVEGFGRDNSKVSQSVIFSTDGLYKVYVSRPTGKGEIEDYNLWATGDVKQDGDAKDLPITSAVINGNWEGNPSRVKKDFIVTGNAILSGNDMQIGIDSTGKVTGTGCIGGNAALQNNNLESGDFYVGKDFGFYVNGALQGAGGNFRYLYVEGNLRQATSYGTLTARANMEVGGKIEPAPSQNMTVKGNLVLGDLGQLEFRQDQSAKITVEGDVWIPYINGVTCSYGASTYNEGCLPQPNNTGATEMKDNRVLGGEDHLIAVSNLEKVTLYNVSGLHQTTADPKAFFSSKADQVGFIDRPEGAEDAKTHCDEIWTRTNQACGSASGNGIVVEDIIKTSIDEFRKKVANAKCFSKGFILGNTNSGNGGSIDNPIYIIKTDTSSIENVNKCYESFSPSDTANLFNGFLVVKFKYKNKTNPLDKKLKGKFIFIFDDEPEETFVLPQMEKGSMALLYFANGIKGSPGITNTGSGCSSESNFNYFVYSLGNIDKIDGFTKNCPLKGTVYFPTVDPVTKECNIGKFSTTAINGSMETNRDLLDALQSAGVICHPNDPDCGSSSVGSSSASVGSSSSSSVGFTDKHYIPVASRLSVKMESKEISKLKAPTDYKTINPSTLVLPRIIRLAPEQASSVSDLSDYYAFAYLNWPDKEPQTDPTTPTCGDLNDPQNFKKDGIYTCTFSGTKVSPFYVVIGKGGDLSKKKPKATCKWSGRSRTMYTGQKAPVNLPDDPKYTCIYSNGDSVGTSVEGWDYLPPIWPDTLTRGSFRPEAKPGSITCNDGETPKIPLGSCGTLTVKQRPEIESCVGANQELTLSRLNEIIIPTITLNDKDNVCSDDGKAPNGFWTSVFWSAKRNGETISNIADADFYKIFNENTHGRNEYNSYNVSGNCGAYGKLEHGCIETTIINVNEGDCYIAKDNKIVGPAKKDDCYELTCTGILKASYNDKDKTIKIEADCRTPKAKDIKGYDNEQYEEICNEAEGNIKIKLKDPIPDNKTIKFDCGAGKVYTITFDPRGGTLPHKDTIAQTKASGKLASLPTPERHPKDDYTFLGWFTQTTYGTKVTLDYVFDSDTTIYARWVDGKGVSLDDGNFKGPLKDTLKVNLTCSNQMSVVCYVKEEGPGEPKPMSDNITITCGNNYYSFGKYEGYSPDKTTYVGNCDDKGYLSCDIKMPKGKEIFCKKQ